MQVEQRSIIIDRSHPCLVRFVEVPKPETQNSIDTATSPSLNSPFPNPLNPMIQQGKELQEALLLGDSISWLHGSKSSTLALIRHSNYELIPTGQLLDMGIAPMCGELGGGGLSPNNVNQNYISVETIRGISTVLSYAANYSFAFDPQRYEGHEEEVFLSSLDYLKRKASPNSDEWDRMLVDLYCLKQWNPDCFSQLIQKHAQLIEESKKEIIAKQFHDEHLLLKALNYNIEKLKAARNDQNIQREVELDFLGTEIEKRNWLRDTHSFLTMQGADEDQKIIYNLHRHCNDAVYYALNVRLNGNEILMRKERSPHWKFYIEEFGENPTAEQFVDKYIRKPLEIRMKRNMRPFQRRYKRMLHLFDPPKVHLTENDRAMISTPFPLVFASTTSKCYNIGLNESNVTKANLGKEIDLIFADKKNIDQVVSWLKENQLSSSVTVKDMALLYSLKKYSWKESQKNIVFASSILSSEESNILNNFLSEYASLYRSPKN